MNETSPSSKPVRRRQPRIERVSTPPSGVPVRFTIATLVNDHEQYEAMRNSLRSGGFLESDCECLYIDNSERNEADAYRGLNALLNAARGTYVILCHQDIRLLTDDRSVLERRLAELEEKDPNWALAGNAGGVSPGVLALRITDPHGADQNSGNLPQGVVSLDENFIVVKHAARFGFSNDLEGFHLYGADICLNAEIAGHTAYVIDFHLAHLSAGRKSGAFQMCEDAFRDKWSRALSSRWIQTTCTLVHINALPLGELASRWSAGHVAGITRRVRRLRSAIGRTP